MLDGKHLSTHVTCMHAQLQAMRVRLQFSAATGVLAMLLLESAAFARAA